MCLSLYNKIVTEHNRIMWLSLKNNIVFIVAVDIIYFFHVSKSRPFILGLKFRLPLVTLVLLYKDKDKDKDIIIFYYY